MWKDSIWNIVVIFQTTILGFVGFYVRRLAIVFTDLKGVSRFVHTWQDEHYLSDIESNVSTSDTMSQPYQSLLFNCLTLSRNRT